MSELTELRFRTAVGGFHKSDVTEYITKTAARHKAELSALEQENQQLRTQLEERTKKLEALQLQLLLEDEPSEEPESPTSSQEPSQPMESLELAAYRRAEHAERTANNRARHLYQQLDQIGRDSQESLSHAREATEGILRQLEEILSRLQSPYDELTEQLSSAMADLAALGDMNPDPAEGMEDFHG